MKTTSTIIGAMAGFLLLGCAHTGPQSSSNNHGDTNGVLLFTYEGQYRMTPGPTLHSNLIRIRIQSVELLKGPFGTTCSKITYSPWYGKISSEGFEFVKTHETQTVSFIMQGDQTARVKVGDILRPCFYPN